MIYRFDHIGITVPSLSEAAQRLESLHPCFHAQHGVEVREALREVSLHKPERLSISLHRRRDSLDIELIEYPLVSPKAGSILPWCYSPGERPDHLDSLKGAVRAQVDRSRDGYSFADIASLLATSVVFNAVVIPVETLSAEARFWEALRFTAIHSDDELAILRLESLLPPAQSHYVLLFRAGYAGRYHTDLEGINEIALLCDSCRPSLRAFPQSAFRSTVDTLLVNDRQIDLGYLRSPSGVLVELFSVRLAGPRR